jgi:hypothetical protein
MNLIGIYLDSLKCFHFLSGKHKVLILSGTVMDCKIQQSTMPPKSSSQQPQWGGQRHQAEIRI